MAQVMAYDMAMSFNWVRRGTKRGFKEQEGICRFIQGKLHMSYSWLTNMNKFYSFYKDPLEEATQRLLSM